MSAHSVLGKDGDNKPRIAVFGTGAIGSLVGGCLARTGRLEVVLFGSWTEGLKAINDTGVRCSGVGGTYTTPLLAVHRDQLWGEPGLSLANTFDCAILCTKSTQRDSVSPAVYRALRPGGIALSLQNGIGNAEALHAAGVARVAVGAISVGTALVSPGVVRRAGMGKAQLADGSSLGPQGSCVDRISTEDLERMAELLTNASIETRVYDDARALLWNKLAINCAINPLTTLLDRESGALVEDAALRELVRNIAREVVIVGRSHGIEVDAQSPEHALEVAHRTATNLSSMLQDVRRGRPIEIDALNGAVVRAASVTGVSAPLNQLLVSMVAAHIAGEAEAEPILTLLRTASGTPTSTTR